MRILIAAGGTGGHINPGICLAEALQRKSCDDEILFVCSKRDIEERIFSRKGFSYKKIDAEGIRKGFGFKFIFLFKFFLSLFESFWIVLNFKPEIVLGMGGYVSAAPVIAAKILRIPAALHEQNSIPGKANRLTARFADLIMTGFESASSYFEGKKTIFTGNPVRKVIFEADIKSACKRFGFKEDIFTILVVGGSQGAAGLNKAAVNALSILKGNGLNFQVIHLAGKTRDDVDAAYKAKGITAHCETYFDEIGLAYALSSLVISRSGAIVLCEIMVTGKPSILIPFPGSADDHQKKNAMFLADRGAAVVLDEKSLSAQLLAEEILKFFNDGQRLITFGMKSGSLAVKDAEERILNAINNILTCRGYNV